MTRFIIGLLLFGTILFADTPNLFINEILSSNASINLDYDFYSFCDWIEIYNSEDTVVNISGYYITDDLSNPFKFQFPDSSIIHPNSFFIVWADDENYYPGNYHIYPEDIDIIVRQDGGGDYADHPITLKDYNKNFLQFFYTTNLAIIKTAAGALNLEINSQAGDISFKKAANATGLIFNLLSSF